MIFGVAYGLDVPRSCRPLSWPLIFYSLEKSARNHQFRSDCVVHIPAQVCFGWSLDIVVRCLVECYGAGLWIVSVRVVAENVGCVFRNP